MHAKCILLLVVLVDLAACGRTDESSHTKWLADEVIQYVVVPRGATMRQTAHLVRQFVHENTEHRGERPKDYGYLEVELYLDELLKYLKRNRDTPPYAQCGERAIMTSVLLKRMGIPARLISVYSTIPGPQPAGHMFLEWQDTAGNWNVSDPDYNLFYVDDHGNEISASDLIRLDPKTDYTPCNDNDCGWNIENEGATPERLRQGNFYGIARTRKWDLISWVNLSRYDLELRHSGPGYDDRRLIEAQHLSPIYYP